MNIDIEKLRSDLMDYFGTAMSYNPMAISCLSSVEDASDKELIKIAKENNFNLENYIAKQKRY